MITKKICMIGSFAVGKTSLVKRFVDGIFDEKYLTSIGVKIDKAEVEVDSKKVNLVIWDIQGDDDLQRIKLSHLKGAAGYILVADGTRIESIEHAINLETYLKEELGGIPFVFVLNKNDLPNWALTSEIEESLVQKEWLIRKTSAKIGDGVEDVFRELAEKII